jgi:hypothetical protein
MRLYGFIEITENEPSKISIQFQSTCPTCGCSGTEGSFEIIDEEGDQEGSEEGSQTSGSTDHAAEGAKTVIESVCSAATDATHERSASSEIDEVRTHYGGEIASQYTWSRDGREFISRLRLVHKGFRPVSSNKRSERFARSFVN